MCVFSLTATMTHRSRSGDLARRISAEYRNIFRFNPGSKWTEWTDRK